MRSRGVLIGFELIELNLIYEKSEKGISHWMAGPGPPLVSDHLILLSMWTVVQGRGPHNIILESGQLSNISAS